MKRTTKGLLIACVVSLVAGLVFSVNLIRVPNAAAGVYVLLPAGAILFGLFLISKALEKETTRYDEEQRANRIRAEQAEEKDAPQEPNHAPIHHHEESFARLH
jgi:hypothetical protein